MPMSSRESGRIPMSSRESRHGSAASFGALCLLPFRLLLPLFVWRTELIVRVGLTSFCDRNAGLLLFCLVSPSPGKRPTAFLRSHAQTTAGEVAAIGL